MLVESTLQPATLKFVSYGFAFVCVGHMKRMPRAERSDSFSGDQKELIETISTIMAVEQQQQAKSMP
jgi:hypothetical protein